MTTDHRTDAPSQAGPRGIPVAPIIAMMLCVFALGSAEYAVIGLLTEIAADVGTTVTSAASVVTIYAVTVAVTGPFLAAYLARYSSKLSMVWLMIIFGVGNVISSVAPSIAVLLAGRVVAALALSGFVAFSIATLARTVPPERIARAISWVAGGLILAMILGAPAGTLIGQNFGWRSTFVALAVVAAIGIALVAIAVPTDPAPETTPGIAEELKVIIRRPVLIALLFSALGQTGFFTAYTYIAPTLENVTGFGGSTIAVLLFVFGVGGFLGNLVGGKLADRNLARALVGLLAVLVIALLALSLAAPSKLAVSIALIALGAAGFAVVPAYQTWVLTAAEGAPSALAANTSGINVGVALGSLIGGTALSQGLSERNLGWIGAVATALGLLVALWAARGRLRSTEPKTADAAA
jgi:MFS transporter, DHA1 family, inner membrane transport protein